jgi:hypothetical protein
VKRDGIRCFTQFVVTTFLPDRKKLDRMYYRPPKGAILTEALFPLYLKDHRALLEKAAPGVRFREVRTGVNSYSFIHPALDKHELAA